MFKHIPTVQAFASKASDVGKAEEDKIIARFEKNYLQEFEQHLHAYRQARLHGEKRSYEFVIGTEDFNKTEGEIISRHLEAKGWKVELKYTLLNNVEYCHFNVSFSWES